MASENICPHCGKPVPATALQGICPECMLKAGLADTGESGPGGTVMTSSPPNPAPRIEEIAPHFPQLQILESLGRGGMGAVYKARQPKLDRLVALKILSRKYDDGPSDAAFAERFQREARALARLSHPDIVAVYDFGETGGFHYLLMEFVDGLTLRQLLEAGKLAPEQALTIVPKICEALQFAHERGIVHRDIKPENILLDKQGQVKIADFGIAKIVGQPAQATLTQEKQIIGTPHYMAPEQVEKPATVDHRADIYSLGVVFYEMLTGELPLGKFQPPSSRMRGIQVDVRLDEVVLHALEKEPDRRYQHASEVKTDVETIASTSPPPPSTTDSRAVAQQRQGFQLKSATFFFVAVCFLIGGVSFGSVGNGIGALLGAVAMLGFSIAGYRYFCAAAALETTPGPAATSAPATSTEQRRRSPWRRAVGAGLLAGVTCFGVLATTSALMPRTYQATAKIRVEDEKLNAAKSDGELDWMLRDVVWSFRSPLMLDRVATDLDLQKRWAARHGTPDLKEDETRALLAKHHLFIERIPLTPMFEIRGLSTLPAEAAEIANKAAEIFCASPAGAKASVVERAEKPRKHIRPNEPLNLTFAAAVGLVLGIVVAASVLLANVLRPPSAAAAQAGFDDSGRGTRGRLPELLPGERVVFFKPRLWLASGKSLPSYRIVFAIPVLLDLALYVTERRVVFVGRILGVLRQQSSLWFPGKAPEGQREMLRECSTGKNRLGAAYVELLSENPTRHWYRSQEARIRIYLRQPESVRDQIAAARASAMPAPVAGGRATPALPGQDESAIQSAPGWVTAVRWTARVLGTLLLLFYGVFILAEGLPAIGSQPAGVQLNFAALGLMLLGFILGWRHDGAAALLIAAGWTLWHISEGRMRWNFFQTPLPVALLYGFCWWATHGRRSKRVAGIIVALLTLLGLGRLVVPANVFVRGAVLDAETGLPVSNAELRLLPRQANAAQKGDAPNARSGKDGRFTLFVGWYAADQAVAIAASSYVALTTNLGPRALGERTVNRDFALQPESPFSEVVRRKLYSVTAERPIKGEDLDGQREIIVPDGLENVGEQQFFHWVAKEGVDLMAWGHKRRWTLWASPALVTADADLWDVPTPAKLEAALASGRLTGLQRDSDPNNGYTSYTFATNTALPLTFAFKTLEGRNGILQVVGASDAPKALEVRYRVLRKAAAENAKGTSAGAVPPVVIATVPASGAADVDPALTEVRATFSKPMQAGSWSWTKWGEETFPEWTGQPKFLDDGRTCVLPVRLKPGEVYALWLNSELHHSFQDRDGRAAEPYLLIFETRKEPEPKSTGE